MKKMAESESEPLLGARSNPRWERGPFAPPLFAHQITSNGRSSHLLQRNASREILPQESHNIQNLKLANPAGSWQLRFAVITILSSVVLERVSFYGFTGNLVLFLNKNPFLWESYNAMSAMFIFFGVTYIMSLLGGWIADSCLGRFKFMLLAFFIYMVGYALLPFVALNSHDSDSNKTLPHVCLQKTNDGNNDNDASPFTENCAWLIYVILIIIGIGAGGLKSSICPFGSEQLSRSSQQTQLSFFNWFYWCVNFGSFVGLGGLTFIQQQYSFEKGYIAGAVTLGLSCIIFIMGRCCYVSRPPDGSVLTNIYRIIKEAWKRSNQHQQLQSLHQKSVSEGVHGHVESTHEEKIGFLDHAKHRYGGSFHNSLVDDVKKLGVVLLVFAVLIPYWIVYFQMQTSFLFQGLHMKLSLEAASIIDNCSEPSNMTPLNPEMTPLTPEDSGFKIVAAWFTLFDASFVIVLLPLFDRVIYPRMAKAGYPFTFSKRIVLGMFFAMLAMITAAIVEFFRLRSFWPFPDCPCMKAAINQTIGDTTYEAADMSVFWQIPQYALIGISEVFASVASLQFAVTVAPKSMKAIITGLYYFFSGIGSLLGTAIISSLTAAKLWFLSNDYGNINCRVPCRNPTDSHYEHACHLDYFFFLLAGIELVSVILFLVVVKKFGLNVDQLILTGQTKDKSDSKQTERRKNAQ